MAFDFKIEMKLLFKSKRFVITSAWSDTDFISFPCKSQYLHEEDEKSDK